MRKFKVGENVLITEGVHAGEIVSLSRFEGSEDNIKYFLGSEKLNELFGVTETEDILEYVNPNYYTITEMATVAVSQKPSMRILLTPDTARKGNPYFKVLDTERLIKGQSKVCRVHFLDKKLEYHMGDGLLDWKITNTDVKEIKKLLSQPHDNFPQYSNWQMACWLWNLEYGFFSSIKNRDDYMNGKLDNEHKDHPSYVPSNSTIPETWTYEQSKEKRKGRAI